MGHFESKLAIYSIEKFQWEKYLVSKNFGVKNFRLIFFTEIKSHRNFSYLMYIYDQLLFHVPLYTSTRSAHTLVIDQSLISPNYRLNSSKNSFLYRGITFWNQIPIDIRSINTLINFKKSLKMYTLANIIPFIWLTCEFNFCFHACFCFYALYLYFANCDLIILFCFYAYQAFMLS